MIFESGSEIVHQIFVYGSATHSYLLAVVVPDLELVRRTLGDEPDEKELRGMIRAEFKRVAISAKLRPFEIPRDFIIELEPFSPENGLLTALRKRIRPAIQRKYAPQLEQLYCDLEQKQRDELAALSSGSSDLSVLEKIGKALEGSLGIEDIDIDSPSSFAELGGDSLGATAFAALLEDIFGVEVSVNAILSPAGNPKQWARSVEAALTDDARTVPTFASVHGKGARQLNGDDLDLAAFLDSRTMDQAAEQSPPITARRVLLTGATGFLGRFLCLEWLEHLAAVEGGRLICLVRATDHTAAVRRLDAAFTGSDTRLEKRYRQLAQSTLEVVVGDIAETSLGLGDREFARLADEVDRVVHPAALVNHVFDYEALFGPNVAGTAGLIGFALSKRQKPIDFVSSAAVAPYLDRSTCFDEESPLLEQITLSQGYASGYGASKWAAEHLLHAASRRFGLPVNVFRGDMMLPHRSFHEQMNVEDIFTRLLYSIIVTGLAPASFYVPEPDGSRPRAHYDGLPVDFIAAVIAEIGIQPHEGLRSFNVTNHADDGLSLDVFVDWIEAAGYPLERIAAYDEWLVRFEASLGALPEDKRQLSSFQVLDYLRQPWTPGRPVAGSRHFDDALRALDIGPETPRLTRDYIDKCLDDMCRLGLIPISEPRALGSPESHLS
jgi:fatty acid CoA ligase FadD9